jgi:beta-galactosidase
MPQAAPRHTRPTQLKTFLFGVPYYPEHWTTAEWLDDPSRMSAAGVNCVRMGEFAWDIMEPDEGVYDFAFFDEHVNRLGGVGIASILCTPTATPPIWLTRKYPDMLRVDINGRRMEPGTRQHCCTTSPTFRDFGRKITSAMAAHFAANPHVIGWQTDNELNCHFSLCYCQACQDAFIQWCRQKYQGDIKALNAAWGAAFWAMSFRDFDEIILPYDRPARHNPGHVLDYKRFVSDTVCQFQREQVAILRPANAKWFVTHNGIMGHIDYAKFAQDLDFMGIDLYPGFDPAEPHWTSWVTDLTRSFAGNVIVPELESGPGGQVDLVLPTPPPGQMRLWAYQAIAHGADGVLHFRWRSCRFGAEEYWCGVLDHDNKPRRRYEEFSHEGNELRHIGCEILGTSVHVEAAVLSEYEQEQAHAAMPLRTPGPADQARTAHKELWRRKLPVGVVEASDSFAGLKLIVVPSFTMLDSGLAERLRAFVQGGGTLLATAWTGTRDRSNRITSLTPPGLLSDLFGVEVDEFGLLGEGENALVFADSCTAPARARYEKLLVDGATPVATWQRDHYAGSAAMTCNRLGAGRAFYLGTYLSPANAAPVFDLVLDGSEVKPVIRQVPAPVEVALRKNSATGLYFLLNHGADDQTLDHLPAGTDLITGGKVTGRLTLGPRGVAIIRTVG